MLNIRPRRLRHNPVLRHLLRDVKIESSNLVYPLFIKEGLSAKKPIPSMPGIFQLTIKEAAQEASSCYKLGIKSVILFGIPKNKDSKASSAHAHDGIIPKTIVAIKKACPQMFVITDVCLCEYMDHGHCGLVNKKGEILNDPSLELLASSALSHVKAGADMVAPSDMMDGRIRAIRKILDTEGYKNTPIMSYAVKYASHFYGPFRDAAESTPQFGDRKTYQMDYLRTQEALLEARLDVKEGADILMVKPALPYLDILTKIKQTINVPLAAYQVSGEYAMIKAAGQKGWIDEKQVMVESLSAIKRAGANLIVTYFAKEFVEGE